MTLPKQFKQNNIENIFMYHYVEEMVFNYKNFTETEFDNEKITKAELPFLIRIKFKPKTTQKELIKLFTVIEGYTAKRLRKFEKIGYIKRCEDPNNRRQKIVELTPLGVEKTDEFIELIKKWETKVTENMSETEIKNLKKLLFKVVEL